MTEIIVTNSITDQVIHHETTENQISISDN
jgi:hypothetical protein